MRARERGFTLLEVLAALMILALAFGALLRLVSSGLNGLGAAEDYASAVLLAESWLDGIGVEQPLGEGESTGAFNERFRWSASISRLPAAPAEDRTAWPVQAYAIELAVLWNEGARQRSISVSTVRLAVP